jgi:hypothetical protein
MQSDQPWYSGVAVIQLHQEAGNHTYMHLNEAELPDTCAAVGEMFACLLLHSVVCPLECHTSGSSSHFLTIAKRFYCQEMLNGILGGDSHGFVHGISLSVERSTTSKT